MLSVKLYPEPILKQVCESVTKFDNELKIFVEDLEKTLYAFNGLGLAAPQVGKAVRIFTILISGKATTFINPEIIEFGGATSKTQEGCLSIPGVRAILNCRRDLVHILGRTVENKRIERHLMIEDAMAAQHEMDHLDGLTFFSRMGTAQRCLKKNSYLKRLKKWKKQQSQRSRQSTIAR